MRLYPSDREIRERLGLSERRWASILPVWERQGFPRKDPLTGARFWPAVEKFLLHRHDLGGEHSIPSSVSDGAECWDAVRKR